MKLIELELACLAQTKTWSGVVLELNQFDLLWISLKQAILSCGLRDSRDLLKDLPLRDGERKNKENKALHPVGFKPPNLMITRGELNHSAIITAQVWASCRRPQVDCGPPEVGGYQSGGPFRSREKLKNPVARRFKPEDSSQKVEGSNPSQD